MVRLKAAGNIMHLGLDLFQFLMVRLKERHYVMLMLTKNIVSIPYGTIKRTKKKRAQPCAIVSIPYGTIKRTERKNTPTWHNSFNSLWYD